MRFPALTGPQIAPLPRSRRSAAAGGACGPVSPSPSHGEGAAPSGAGHGVPGRRSSPGTHWNV